ncbi:MAG TPA: hypothetical protein DEA08_15900, partial [Planctomycetes bacterium]|nr:hypothetical protein [Planctomycetota bacterium]
MGKAAQSGAFEKATKGARRSRRRGLTADAGPGDGGPDGGAPGDGGPDGAGPDSGLTQRAREVDGDLRRCRRRQRALDARIATLLAEMERAQLWRALGYSSLSRYAFEVLGYSSSKTSDLVRIGRRVDLEKLQDAFRQGQLSYKFATEVARVATPENEDEWLAKADELPLRDLQAEARGREREHQVLLRLDDEGFRVFEAAIESVRRAGGPFGLAEAVVEICRERVEAQPIEPRSGRDGGDRDGADPDERLRVPRNASHRIVYTVCPECGVGTQETSAGAIEVGPAEIERRSCDAEVLDLRQGEAARVTRTIPNRIRQRIWGRDRGKCQVPGCGLRGSVEIHHVDKWEGGHDPARMLVLCDQHHEQIHDELLRVQGSGDADLPGCGLEFFTSDGERLGRAGDRRRSNSRPAGSVGGDEVRASEGVAATEKNPTRGKAHDGGGVDSPEGKTHDGGGVDSPEGKAHDGGGVDSPEGKAHDGGVDSPEG